MKRITLCALVAGMILAGAAAAHDTSPGACKIEDWRFLSVIAGMVAIEGVTTCTEGKMHMRLYEGEGEDRRFLGASTTYFEGHVFDAMFMDVAEPTNPTIEYVIEEGETW